MKRVFFSTFMAGTGDIVEIFLREDLGAKITGKWDGLIEYVTDKPMSVVRQLKYFNNSYLVLASFQSFGFDQFTQSVMKYLRRNGSLVWKELKNTTEGKLTYRLMFYDKNQPAHIDKGLLESAERWISGRQLVDRTSPKAEISGIYRNDGRGWLGIRLTRHPDYGWVLKPGELRPEVAEILIRLSNPEPEEVFLDPFAGNGALVAARYDFGGAGEILCSDIDEEKIKLLKKRFGKQKIIKIRQADAANLNHLTDMVVDKVVTDPPWGNFERNMDPNVIYPGMLREFCRVLKTDGIIVLLTAAKDALENAIGEQSKLRIVKQWDVLISGRKASIYLAEKVG